MQLGHDNNNALGYARGSDGVTVFYSIGKYPTYAAPIALTKSEEMNLIIPEVAQGGRAPGIRRTSHRAMMPNTDIFAGDFFFQSQPVGDANGTVVAKLGTIVCW